MHSLGARSHNFIIPVTRNRDFMLRALYHAVCHRSKPSVKTAGKTIVLKQYFIINSVACRGGCGGCDGPGQPGGGHPTTEFS